MKSGSRKMCTAKKRYTTAKMAGEFVGICTRTLRAFFFNVLVFCLGFGACYMYAVQKINKAASAQCDTEVQPADDGKSIDASLRRFRIQVFLDAHGSNGCAIVSRKRD